MKLSTKLILLFLACIPVSLFAYNWLLREQYLAGKITMLRLFEYDESKYSKKNLPQIKHLMIDGMVKSEDFNCRLAIAYPY